MIKLFIPKQSCKSLSLHIFFIVIKYILLNFVIKFICLINSCIKNIIEGIGLADKFLKALRQIISAFMFKAGSGDGYNRRGLIIRALA